MSKRVRTSLRASNKGRSLRPKAVLGRRSLPPDEPLAPVSEAAAPDLDGAAAPDIDGAASGPAAPLAASGAEPAVCGDDAAADSARGDPLAAAIKAAAAVQAAEPADEAQSDASAPGAEASANVAEAEASAAIDDSGVSAPAAAPIEAAAAIEAEPAANPSAEPPARASQPEPIAVQASAVEESDPADEAPRARKPEEDLDASGVSAEFFRDDEASLAPTIEDVPEEPTMRVVLSPAAVARRARFRRVVAGVVAFAGVISLAVIGKSIAAPHRQPAVAAVTVAAPAPPPAIEPPKSEPIPAKVDAPAVAADAPAAEANKPDEAKSEGASADDKKTDDKDAKADDNKADDKDAKADDKKAEPSAEPDPEAAKKLQQETLSLLNRGRSKDAIEKAREAIAADPTDAIAYLYLGSALQDSGHWKDGIEAYSECVRHATKGSVSECRIMGGHK